LLKKKKSYTYTFIIKNNNTGIWPDTYILNVTSENGWDLNVSYEDGALEEVDVGDEVEVNVTVDIPKYTDVSSDILKFNVRSRKNGEFNVTICVTTTVVNPNIFEQFYHFFESLAEEIGLDDILGDYATAFLIILLIMPILILLLLLVLIIKKKHVIIVCLERIKEITPDEDAEFELTISNPTRETKTYELKVESDSSPEGLEISLSTETIYVESKQSEVVKLNVSPNDSVKADDWAEVKVVANVAGRKKSAKISTVTTIVGTKSDLRISGVFHWPRVFKKGDRVETSFKVENKGNVSANNITVVLLVNGEEKNKVEDITIPRGGYAELEIPWIAVKGKNDVDIVVK